MRVAVASRRRPPWTVPAGLTTLVGSAILCGLTACSLITGPLLLPPGAESFAPPAVYARWWALTEACSGRSGDLRAVRWYRVPGSQFTIERQEASGYYNYYSNRLIIAEEVLENGPIVRHEMLHALLQRRGHRRSEFLGACASLVLCQGICITKAGPWHPPQQNYVILPPESLDVSSRAELLPAQPDGERWLTLWVIVRNPRDRAVVVAAPGDPVAPPTFGYDLRGPAGGISGGEVATDSSTLFFQPLETKRYLFEFKVASDLSEHCVPPGDYLVLGSYARRRSAYERVAARE